MSYIAKLIEQECPDCQAQRVATILMRNGVTNPIKEHHFDIFIYFKDRLEYYKKLKKPLKYAVQDTLVHFDISRFKLYRIRKEF